MNAFFDSDFFRATGAGWGCADAPEAEARAACDQSPAPSMRAQRTRRVHSEPSSRVLPHAWSPSPSSLAQPQLQPQMQPPSPPPPQPQSQRPRDPRPPRPRPVAKVSKTRAAGVAGASSSDCLHAGRAAEQPAGAYLAASSCPHDPFESAAHRRAGRGPLGDAGDLPPPEADGAGEEPGAAGRLYRDWVPPGVRAGVSSAARWARDNAGKVFFMYCLVLVCLVVLDAYRLGRLIERVNTFTRAFGVASQRSEPGHISG